MTSRPPCPAPAAPSPSSRILRGVSTNIPFLQAVLDDPAFVAGDLSTSFIDERPELLKGRESKDRGTKILSWLVDTTVNRPNGENPLSIDPSAKPRPSTWRPRPPRARASVCSSSVPPASRRPCASRPPLAVTETTFRDAHQSLLATRVRTRDLARVAPYVARLTPGLLSVEAWGGATYDVALRFLGEDPWERLDALREALPNVAIQMLLRGRNTVGYTPYPTEVTDAFVTEAAASGVDIFRIFDALNDVSADAAGDRRGPGDRHRGGRSRPLLHGGSAGSRRRPVHARLLPGSGRADRRRGSPHPRDQGHGGPAAPGRRGEARDGAARAVRPAGARPHPRQTAAGSSRRCWPPRRRGRMPWTRPRPHGRKHEPAVAVGAGRRARAHRTRHGPRPRGRQRPEPYWEAVRHL